MSHTALPVLALDLGGTKLRGGVVYPDDSVTNVRQASTPATEGPEAVLWALEDMARGLLAEVDENNVGACRAASGESAASVQLRQTGSARVLIGIGSAGVIDPGTGTVLRATDALPGWTGTRIGEFLRHRMGVPVAVINDVWAHALGESRAGAGRGASSELTIAVGTGVGGAFVYEGRVLPGHRFGAGNVGHLPVPSATGRLCSCGGTGHLEAVASGPAVSETYRLLSVARDDLPRTGDAAYQEASGPSALRDVQGGTAPETVTAQHVAVAARDGDPTAARAFQLAGRALGEALGGLIQVLDPERVVVGGGLMGAADLWWDTVVAVAGEHAGQPHPVQIQPAELGDLAPLIGAARWAREACGDDDMNVTAPEGDLRRREESSR